MTPALQTAASDAETELRACAVYLMEAHAVLVKDGAAFGYNADLDALKNMMVFHALEARKAADELRDAMKQ